MENYVSRVQIRAKISYSVCVSFIPQEKDARDIEIPNIKWEVFELMMRYNGVLYRLLTCENSSYTCNGLTLG